MNVVELVLSRHGFKRLNPVQQEAVDRGLLGERNMLVVAPTASGKTLIGELAMIKSVLEGKKAVYLSPLRALASEKYYYFKESRPEYKVAITTGDYHKSGRELSDYDIIIATYERFDSLIRNRAPRLGDVGVIVMDEIHLVGFPKRGPVVEMIVARANSRIIGLSATIGNPEELAERLNAELVKSDRRPVPLRYGALLGDKIYREDGVERVRPSKDKYSSIVIRTLDSGGQVLIFRDSRRKAESLAKRLADLTRRFLTPEEYRKLRALAAELADSEYEKERSELAQIISLGSAYHHAGLSRIAREVIERGFRERLIKVIVATPTLAAGVNLPARTVVPFLKRYDRTLGISVEIPVIEFRQMAGRAGRPDFDEYGEVIAIVKDRRDLRLYFDYYVYGSPEAIESKLTEKRYLIAYTLVAITEGYRTLDDIEELFSKTLGRRQDRRMPERIPIAIENLREMKMIEGDELFRPTKLGGLTVRFYLMPSTVYRAIETLSNNDPAGEYAYLHMLYFLDDVNEVVPYSISKAEEALPLGEIFDYLPFDAGLEETRTSIAFANLFYRRIREEDINEILERYRLYPGDFAALKDTVERVVYSLAKISAAIGLKAHAKVLEELTLRVRYGIRRELLELVMLEGVGRVIARRMYNFGIRSIEDVLEACESGYINAVPGIGEKRAKKICESAKKLKGLA